MTSKASAVEPKRPITRRKIALITGSANRLGRAIAQELHQLGCSTALHYSTSEEAAFELNQQFNQVRANSSATFRQDLSEAKSGEGLIKAVIQTFGSLDYLVNNASIFYPLEFSQVSENDINAFMTINYRQPIELAVNAYPFLAKNHGAIVNLIDIYALRGLSKHSVYVESKAALLNATQQLAREFAPKVRVNAVSPGAILWPDTQQKVAKDSIPLSQEQLKIVQESALKKTGKPIDVSKTVAFLLGEATYTTGANIAVDGGRQWFI
jgi:pteridine reductase